MDLDKKEYDMLIPIGENCQPAFYLRETGLRVVAYPFDWQIIKLKTIIHLLKTRFVDFFTNYEDITKSKPVDPGISNIYDINNEIYCMHYVIADNNIEKNVTNFRKLMIKRYIRLDKNINRAKKIALLSNRTDSIKELEKFLSMFSNIYKDKEITLINICNSEIFDDNKLYKINDKLNIIQYRFLDKDAQEENSWIGNYDRWINILSGFSINKEFNQNIE